MRSETYNNSQGQERPLKDRFWGLKPTDFVHRVRGEREEMGHGEASIQVGTKAPVRLEPRGSHVWGAGRGGGRVRQG